LSSAATRRSLPEFLLDLLEHAADILVFAHIPVKRMSFTTMPGHKFIYRIDSVAVSPKELD
jgi:hypothetical protein